MAGNYDEGLRITYSLASADYGASNFDHGGIPVPTGKMMCRIEQVGVTALAEAFAGSTSTPGIQFGIVGDLDKFANIDFGAIAVGNGKSFSASESDGGYDNDYGGFGVINCGATAAGGENITQIEVTGIAAVGSPTGQAITHITLMWW